MSFPYLIQQNLIPQKLTQLTKLLLLTFFLTLFPLGAQSISLAEENVCDLKPSNGMENEVDGLTLGNTHEVYSSKTGGRIIRGHEPGKNASQLPAIGVTDVVIFKVDTFHKVKNEKVSDVQTETEALIQLGIHPDHIKVIAMPWQKITDMKAECIKTVSAANYLLKVSRTPKATAYFHCSAGQDRTGLLAGVLRMALDGWSPKEAFSKEMCAHGYGFGDTKRPGNVSSTVENNLTPIFLQIAEGLQNTSTPIFEIDFKVCDSAATGAASQFNAKEFSCK